jgi:hypothetical protein
LDSSQALTFPEAKANSRLFVSPEFQKPKRLNKVSRRIPSRERVKGGGDLKDLMGHRMSHH